MRVRLRDVEEIEVRIWRRRWRIEEGWEWRRVDWTAAMVEDWGGDHQASSLCGGGEVQLLEVVECTSNS